MRVKDKPALTSGIYGCVGTLYVKCPSCGTWIRHPYGIKPFESIPMPKECPFCGKDLTKEEIE